MTRTLVTAVCGMIWLATVGATARADIDIELSNGDRVTASVTEAGDSDVFRVRVPAGALLDVAVKGVRRTRRGPANPVALRVLDETGGEPAAGAIVTRGKGARLRRYPVPADGEYRLLVTGVQAGSDYKLSVKWRFKKRFRFGADTTVEAPPLPFFAADAGSTVVLDLKAARRSTAQPRLASLEGQGTGVMIGIDQPEDEEATRHSATIVVTRTDTYQLVTAIDEDAHGEVIGRIRIKPDRTRSRLRLNTARLAAPGTGGAVFARGLLVGSEGATILFGTDALGAVIEGASVEIPAGALTAPVPILIGSSTDVAPGLANGGGPSMFCGPSGTDFGTLPARVTMPFNPNAFDALASGLKVLQRDDKKGGIEEITLDVVVNTQLGQVTFPVTRFSSFRVVGPAIPAAVPGDVTGDDVADLVLPSGSVGASRVLVFAGGTPLLAAGALDTGAATAVLTDDVNASAAFGAGVDTADVNGDGTEDVVVSDPATGVAFAFFGGNSFGSAGASTAQVAIDVGDAAGGAALGVGDVDDDSIADIVLGSPATAGAAPAGTPGAALLFGGRVRFDPGSVNALDPGDPSLRTLTGEADLDEFGSTIVVGDVTGDGLSDVVVGATRDGAGRPTSEPGRVYVFPGASSAISAYAGSRPPPIVIDGAAAADRFGASLAVGDVNGDGVADLVVGAPGSRATDNGAAHLFLGGETLTGQLTTADAYRSYTGNALGDRFGTAVLCSDVNGDGFADVVSGTPGVDLASLTQAVGAVFVFQGGRRDRDVPASGPASGASRGIAGVLANEHFGAALQAVDLDADGAPELVVAAPFHEATPNGDEGRVYVFSGPLAPGVNQASQADLTVTGLPGERLGAPGAERLPN